MTPKPIARRVVLVTGAEGYVGRLLVEALVTDPSVEVVATDLRLPTAGGARCAVLDITDELAVRACFTAFRPEIVVHLAAVVTPRPGQSRESQHQVDVEGTENVLAACVEAGVGKLLYTSSGAAYGYHPDNSALLTEQDPLRGNEVFAYAWHKRKVEELLEAYRALHPELGQLIFRVSTVLGERVHNQITALFEGRVVVGLSGVDTPFCLVWDQDVVACLVRGVQRPDAVGVYNLTGDGVVTLREIAAALGRPFLPLPSWLLRGALSALSGLGLSPYGPEQVLFLAHRPVLSNRALKEEFGFQPKATRDVLEVYRRGRA